MILLWLGLLSLTGIALLFLWLACAGTKKNFIISGLVVFIIPLVAYLGSGRLIPLAQYRQQVKEKQVVTRVLKQLHHPKVVIAKLKAYAKLHPNVAKVHYLLAKIYLGMGDTENAAAEFHQAHQLSPKNKTYTSKQVSYQSTLTKPLTINSLNK